MFCFKFAVNVFRPALAVSSCITAGLPPLFGRSPSCVLAFSLLSSRYRRFLLIGTPPTRVICLSRARAPSLRSLRFVACSRQVSSVLAISRSKPLGTCWSFCSVNQCQFVGTSRMSYTWSLHSSRLFFSFYHGWYLYQIQETVINAFLSSPDTA